MTVKRVTEPKPLAKPSREKDPKKVAAGRAGAAACKARQDKMLEEFRVAKETLCCSNSTDAANVATASTVLAPQTRIAKQEESASTSTTDWTPWIIGAAGLVGVVMFQHLRNVQPAVAQQQQKTAQSRVLVVDSSPMPVASQLDNTTFR